MCSFQFLHARHMINIVKICNSIITIHCTRWLLLLCKSKILNTTIIAPSQSIRLNHFDSWLVYLGIFSSDWPNCFFLTNEFITSRVCWSTALTSWFIILSLITSIITSIIIQNSTSSHISWESLTWFYFFEILLFTINRILIIQLSLCDRWHLWHKWMWSFLILLISIEQLFCHNLLLYLSVLSCLLRSDPV